MSTGTKIPLDKAMQNAERFRSLFDGTYDRWEIAGSIRRKRPMVGDVEHVVIPRGENGSQLWGRVNDLLATDGGLFAGDGALMKAVYPNGTHRWGNRYRGIVFEGVRHEVFIADKANWGAILAIRTGPAEFSKRLVTDLRTRGYRQQGGYLLDNAGQVIDVPDERTFLEFCGCRWIEPEDRK